MADMMFYARQDDADERKDYIKEHGERVTVRRGRDLSRFNEAEGWICWV